MYIIGLHWNAKLYSLLRFFGLWLAMDETLTLILSAMTSDNIDGGAVPLVKTLSTTLYAFTFYNSEDIYIESLVKLCPSSSSSCDLIYRD